MPTLSLHRAGRTLLMRFEAPLSDAPSVESVRQEWRKRRPKAVVLDTTGASYVDSDGLRWLLSLKSACDAEGLPLRILARKGSKVWRNLSLLNANLALFGSGRAAWRGALA